MGTGYQRADTGNNIATGNIVNASDHDAEYDAIEAAFDATLGHTHDGTSAEGGPITKLGPVQDLIVSATQVLPKTTNTLDIGSATFEFKDMYLTGDLTLGDAIDIGGNATISGGTITLDGTPTIGGTPTFSGVVTFSSAPVFSVAPTFSSGVTLQGTSTLSGTISGTGTVDMSSGTTTVATPSAGTDAVTKTYADAIQTYADDLPGHLVMDYHATFSGSSGAAFTPSIVEYSTRLVRIVEGWITCASAMEYEVDSITFTGSTPMVNNQNFFRITITSQQDGTFSSQRTVVEFEDHGKREVDSFSGRSLTSISIDTTASNYTEYDIYSFSRNDYSV